MPIYVGYIIAVGLLALFMILALLYMAARNHRLSNENHELKNKNEVLLGQKKSSEIRLGLVGENLAPFLKDWPWNPRYFRFLGNPVDGIQFTNDEVIFVEIKTGKSRLSAPQKKFKKLVNEGKVSFATFRVGENGATLHKEEVDQ